MAWIGIFITLGWRPESKYLFQKCQFVGGLATRFAIFEVKYRFFIVFAWYCLCTAVSLGRSFL